MALVKAARPLDIFTRDEWTALTRVSRWRGLAMVLHGWALALGVAAGTAWLWTAGFAGSWALALLATPLALAIIGGRQLGLSILMHEAAHGALHPNRRVNNLVGQWLCGDASGSDLTAYRAYHLTHHKYTQQAEDPDLPLSAPFPTSAASMRRKVIRDLTGQTFVKQRGYQFAKAWQGCKAMVAGGSGGPGPKRSHSAGTTFNASPRTGISAPVESIDGAKVTAYTVARFLLVQAALLLLALLTLGPAAGVIAWGLWLAALASPFQLFLRIRNIAEHACTPTGQGDPFTHARTTYAGFWERLTLAPYYVNYHAEHHLFMGLPAYHLPRAHALLLAKGYGARMTIAPSYAEVLRTATRAEPLAA